MRIVTFNVQNMRLRDGPAGPQLDGARDGDDPTDAATPAFDRADRRLTAAVLARADADIVVLQEVFDRATLDFFHDRFLRPAGVAPYPHRLAPKGNDGHGRNLAVLSRRPLPRVESHAALTPADLGLAPPPGQDPALPLFRRDLLVLTLGPLTLYALHLKAPWPDPAQAHAVRRQEAEATRRLIERRFAVPAAAWWLVLGDLNEPGGAGDEAAKDDATDTGCAAAPLMPPFSVDLLARLPAADRWTYAAPGDHRRPARPDAMLASPALAAAVPSARPEILRGGMGREVAAPGGALPGTGWHRPHASDHAAVLIDLPGL